MTYDRRKSDHVVFDERHRPTTPGTSIGISQLTHTRRFCESCGEYRPKNSSPFVKGWRCTDCKSKEKA